MAESCGEERLWWLQCVSFISDITVKGYVIPREVFYPLLVIPIPCALLT